MKLARFEVAGAPRIGLVKDDAVIDLAEAGLRYATMRDLILAGDAGLAEVAAIGNGGAPRRSLADLRLLAPVERPGKYLAIGMNYAKHLEEADRLASRARSIRSGPTSRRLACPVPMTPSSPA